MAGKKHRPEEAVAKLRQVDVLVSRGQSVAEAIRAIGVTEVTYYRWRREFGGLKSDQVKRPKDLETENARLRKAIADLTPDKQILAEAARGNCRAPRAGAPVSSTSCGRRGCPSAALVRRSASTARPGARYRGAARMVRRTASDAAHRRRRRVGAAVRPPRPPRGHGPAAGCRLAGG